MSKLELNQLLKYVTHVGVREKIDKEGLTPENITLLKQYITHPSLYQQAIADSIFQPIDETDSNTNDIPDVIEMTIHYALAEGLDIIMNLPEDKVVADGAKDGYKLTKSDLPIYNIEGYVFDGWFVGEDKVNKGTILEGTTVTLTAKFTKLELEVAPVEE